MHGLLAQIFTGKKEKKNSSKSLSAISEKWKPQKLAWLSRGLLLNTKKLNYEKIAANLSRLILGRR